MSKRPKPDGTPSRVELWLRTVIGRAYPRVIGATREKSWLFFDTFLPLMSTAAYVFVYRAIGAPQEYIGFVVVGGAMTSFWVNVLWSMSSQLYWEKESGNLGLFIAAPAPLMAILLGMAVGGLFFTFVRAIAIIVIGSLLFEVHYALSDLWLLALTFALTMTALYGMGMLFASLYLLWGREAWHISNLLQEPVYLLSGFYFPVRHLGFGVAVVASIIPLTLGLDAMRQMLFPVGPTLGLFSPVVEVAALAVLSVVFIVAARFTLDYLERLARREGRLTERRG